MTDILIGVAIAAATGFGVVMIRWAVVSLRLPKRIARLEAAMVMGLRMHQVQTDALIAVVRTQQGHELNGELEEVLGAMRASKAEMTQYLSGAAVSQRPGA